MCTLISSGLGWLKMKACILKGAYNDNLENQLNLTNPLM
jgi:hypothetical protein